MLLPFLFPYPVRHHHSIESPPPRHPPPSHPEGSHSFSECRNRAHPRPRTSTVPRPPSPSSQSHTANPQAGGIRLAAKSSRQEVTVILRLHPRWQNYWPCQKGRRRIQMSEAARWQLRTRGWWAAMRGRGAGCVWMGAVSLGTAMGVLWRNSGTDSVNRVRGSWGTARIVA